MLRVRERYALGAGWFHEVNWGAGGETIGLCKNNSLTVRKLLEELIKS